jgi:4-amino-4-deoxy-L-arabinose transferase-like glycosyltransferase
MAVLAAILVVAAVAFAWGANRQVLEVYYAASVRSMSSSWHDFLFGAFDPRGTITLDKLPGAFWLQALSVRVFGLHAWAIVLPQIVEGVATVLALYVVVRRHAGTLAGLLAAALLAISPATVALDRGNVADSLLILLMVLAADATTRATASGRLRTLLLAGGLVGLAFQAKMIEAWALLPALAAMYLLAAPGGVRRRLGHLAAAGAVVVLVSLSWMTFVTVVPSHDRPAIDGSRQNSIYQQVFDYNGFGRIDAPLAGLTNSSPAAAELLGAFRVRHSPGWDRLLVGSAGRDGGWWLPAALLAAVGVLTARRRRNRRDPVRAGVVLWGVWLVTLFALFSVAGRINPYYLGALAPAIAALCAIGLSTAWQQWSRIQARLATPAPAGPGRGFPGLPRSLAWLIAASIATTAYALWLLPAHNRPGWLPVATAALGAVALGAAVVALTRPSQRTFAGALTAVCLAAALVPVVASASLTSHGSGPFDTPFQSSSVTAVTQQFARSASEPSPAAIAAFEQFGQGARYPLATYTSLLAAPLIYATGQEVLPIGGFQGTNPSPTLNQLQRLIAQGQLHLILGPISSDPRMRWAATHCRHVAPVAGLPVLYCGSFPASG